MPTTVYTAPPRSARPTAAAKPFFADEQRIDDVRFGAPVVEGDRACVEYRARFLDRQGTAMTLAGCAMARFNADGLITEARDYWHVQEGHEPPPEWDW
jgi:hypothetical protein